MQVEVLHVLKPTTDIDLSLVTVVQRAVEFAFLGPPVPWLLASFYVSFNSLMLSIPLSVSISLLSEVWTKGSELCFSFLAKKLSTTIFISTLNCLPHFANSFCFRIPTVCEVKFGYRIVQPDVLIALCLKPMVVKISPKLPNPISLPNFRTFNYIIQSVDPDVFKGSVQLNPSPA